MATLTVYAEKVDGWVQSSNSVYATARAGGTMGTGITGGLTIGQQLVLGTYYCTESVLSFDTSILGPDVTITAAVLSVTGYNNNSAQDFTIEARLHDWGFGLTTADWVAGADLGSKTLLAHFDTAGFGVESYNAFTDDAFVANINKTGLTRIVLASDRHRLNNTPSGAESVDIYSGEGSGGGGGDLKRPKLVITYTARTPVVAATATTGETSASTSHTVNLPSGISAGDLLVLAINAIATSTPATPSGWTLASPALADPAGHNKGWVYWKAATGSEGSTLAMTSDTNSSFGAVCYRVTGADLTNPLTEIGYTVSAPYDQYPNPPEVIAEPHRDWLFVEGVFDYSAGYVMNTSGYNYSTPVSGRGENSGNYTRMTLAYRGMTSVASEDPGYFTAWAQTYWCAFSFAIAPAYTDRYPIVYAHRQTTGTGSPATVYLPGTGAVAGELLVMVIGHDSGGNATTPSGWTSLWASANFSGFWKIAAGGESSVNVTTGASNFTAHTYRIRNHGGTCVASSVVAGAQTDYPDPPSLTSGFGAVPTLWLVAAGNNAYTYSAGPEGYLQTRIATSANYTHTATARRYLIQATEDPSTFTPSTPYYPKSVTIAVAPLSQLTGVGGIASAEAFGTIQMVYNRELTGVGGIASAEAFGLIQVNAIKGLTVPAISALAGTHAWSVATWAKWTSRTAGRVFSAWDASGNELVALVVDNSSSSAKRAAHTVSGAAGDGAYHLYAMTYDGTTLRFYIDGRAAGTEVASSTSLAAVSGMRFGSGYQGANPFGGSIDDGAVFDYYLSASQVAGLYVSGTTSGVDLVHDSSGSSMLLAGWQPHAYMAGYAAVDTYSTALDLAANGGCIAIPVQIAGKMALRQVSLWNTDAATARSWNWSLYHQPRQDSISNVLTRVAVGAAADAFTPSAASKRAIGASGAPTLLGPGSYWLVIQNNHSTSTFGLGSIASGPLSINRAQTKTLTVPVGATLDFTAATWTKVAAIYAVILEGDVLGLWGAF